MSRSGATVPPRSGGFSLIEVVVALAILTLGITSVIALFTAATAAHRRAIHRSQAADLAEWAIADVESALRNGRSPEEIVEAPPLDVLLRDWPGYDVEVSIVPLAGERGDDEVIVNVEIIWRSRGVENSLRFQQIVVRRESLR